MFVSAFTFLGILSAILFFVLLWLWGSYNTLVVKRNQVQTDFADIAVQLQRRASLIERLANIVREYAKHEKKTLENVTKARATLDTSKTAKQAARAQNMLTQTLRSLFMVAENYPKLKASQNYLTLRTDLKETEDSIARYREEYNRTVQDLNTFVQTFPNLLAAAIFRFESQEYFETE